MSSYAEYKPDGDFAPMNAVATCFERNAQTLLIDRPSLTPEFFDLHTGVTGELVQKLAQYSIRLAYVVPDLVDQPERFQEFARDANRGSRTRFFGSRSDDNSRFASDRALFGYRVRHKRSRNGNR